MLKSYIRCGVWSLVVVFALTQPVSAQNRINKLNTINKCNKLLSHSRIYRRVPANGAENR